MSRTVQCSSLVSRHVWDGMDFALQYHSKLLGLEGSLLEEISIAGLYMTA